MDAFALLPPALIAERRWVVWRLETRRLKDGTPKVTKVPYQAHVPAQLASSTNAATWGTFAAACAVLRAGRVDGIGFVLGDGFIGVDIDHCRDAATNTKTPEAQALIDELNSYTEVSPSGTGVHILLRGDLPTGCKAQGIEVYGAGRYFTITGQRLGVQPDLQARPEAIAALVGRLCPPLPPRKDGKPRGTPRTPKPAPTTPLLDTKKVATFPSASTPGTTYTASYDPRTRRGTCSCPGHTFRKFNRACRHLVALGAST